MAYYPPRAWVAAANPDIQDLRRLIDDAASGSLADPDGKDINQKTGIHRLEEPATTEYGEWVSTPLLRAIKHNNVEHVRAMLEAGVDPNGVAIKDMLRFAIRIAADDDEMMEMLDEMNEGEMLSRLRNAQRQGEGMIDREISRQRHAGNACPFWGHFGSRYSPDGQDDILPEWAVDRYGNIPMSSLTVAAWCGRPQIIDLLLAHGADTASWMRVNNDAEMKPTCSNLSLITPLHAAIGGGHLETIRHLLKRGFSPNTTRLLVPEGATSALQYSIITRWKAGSSAFEILAADPRADFSLQTPYLQVSCLHFAVATLDRNLVERVMAHTTSIDFPTNVTALGHTVLHIACLPATDADLRFYNSSTGPAVQASVHNCRGIMPLNGDGYVVGLEAQHHLQSEMVEFLLERHHGDIALLVQQDVFGNTPLHYLAAAHQPNVELVARLRGHGGEALEAWNSCLNEKVHSPQALYGADGE